MKSLRMEHMPGHFCAHPYSYIMSFWQCKINLHFVHLQNRCSVSQSLKLILQDCIIYISPRALEMLMMGNRMINRLKCSTAHTISWFFLVIGFTKQKHTQTKITFLQLNRHHGKWNRNGAVLNALPRDQLIKTKTNCRGFFVKFLLRFCQWNYTTDGIHVPLMAYKQQHPQQKDLHTHKKNLQYNRVILI